MPALTDDIQRIMEVSRDVWPNAIPMTGGARCYRGSLVGVNAGGFAKALALGDASFGGLCTRMSDNTGSGQNGDVSVQVICKVVAEFDFTDVIAPSDEGSTAFGVSDNECRKAAGGGAVPVGKIFRFISPTKALVALEATRTRSI